MRNIVTALIAVSILGLVAVPVSALDAKSFYEQQERTAGGA
jgi:acid phosphatase class B